MANPLALSPFALSPEEVEYQISRCTPSQIEILSYVVLGKTDTEIGKILSMPRSRVQWRITSAWDRAGCANRSHLVALYSIWRCQQHHTDKTTVFGRKNKTTATHIEHPVEVLPDASDEQQTHTQYGWLNNLLRSMGSLIFRRNRNAKGP